MTLKLKIVNKKEFERKMDLKVAKTLSNVRKMVRVTANEVRNTAIESIVQNPRAGDIVTRYNPKRTIPISKEGNPPAGDTGFLASNIHLVLDADLLGASIESRAKYSAFLEFGTRHMRPRPFMQPALEKGRAKYKRMFAKAVKDGI